MAIGVQRHLDVGVTQPLGDDLRVHSLLEHETRMCMAEIMKTNACQSRTPSYPGKVTRDYIREKRLSIRMGEQQVFPGRQVAQRDPVSL